MIQFFYEDCLPLQKEHELKATESTQLVGLEGFKLGEVSAIFCSDAYLLEINKGHLNHDYYTDIITFSYNNKAIVSGDLFISIDRVKENASIYQVSLLNETSRIVIHGLLHLCGYSDKSKEETALMRSKEKQYLKMIGFT